MIEAATPTKPEKPDLKPEPKKAPEAKSEGVPVKCITFQSATDMPGRHASDCVTHDHRTKIEYFQSMRHFRVTFLEHPDKPPRVRYTHETNARSWDPL